jgi:23S rRNA (cytosine1962-C5)-methyltransferase
VVPIVGVKGSPVETEDRPNVFLVAGGDRRVGAGHPWAFSNEIRMDPATRALPMGSLVTLRRVDGRTLGVATFNPHALIGCRVLARAATARIDAGFFADRLRRALDLRHRLFARPFYRLIHAEGDGLPGLIVDRYGEVVVVQANTAGMERLLPEVVAALQSVLSPAAIVVRNDSRARALEGLPQEVALATGTVDGPVAVEEGGARFFADVVGGQKTGWFFDQRDNRRFAAPLASGGRALDVYCHTGGFAIAAAVGGAVAVLGIDSAAPALALAEAAARASAVGDRCTFQRGDAFAELERLATAGQRFRLVVADPPAFVKSRKDLASGLQGYRKLARLAAALVEPSGFLFLATCSHVVEPAAFLDTVVRGLGRAQRTGRILRIAGADADHPVHPHVPETGYLKTVCLQLD